MAKMKAALIGCGNMGHMQARAAQLAGLEVVAFCDIKPEAAQQRVTSSGGATPPPTRTGSCATTASSC